MAAKVNAGETGSQVKDSKALARFRNNNWPRSFERLSWPQGGSSHLEHGSSQTPQRLTDRVVP